ncbi:hypothetical protein BKA56DRAFT_573968 [Ilyonectria sp. MPI-CAGE-AT-0026]|nr:hypothetical protein BKA56DRAFT_573968 [Ilyonectria sp. MPI-CAGE-AT-0026]
MALLQLGWLLSPCFSCPFFLLFLSSLLVVTLCLDYPPSKRTDSETDSHQLLRAALTRQHFSPSSSPARDLR